jgi:MerR family transcriptional regulator, redox-sensitive transcriptional activator SoxR
MTARTTDRITIGELAARSGVATSAIRFYESLGLLVSERTDGNHRMYPRYALRRVAFIRAAQRVGLSLEEITEALTLLPADRAPTKAEWRHISRSWRSRIDERIVALQQLRDDLASCIGCGCLSLASCRLSNPQDAAAAGGDGARFLLGDDPAQFAADP